jgi:hypothetical protein
MKVSESEPPNSKQPAGSMPAAPGLLTKIRPEHLKFALRSLIAGVTALLISRIMTTYSGTTLLFPKSWREIVIGLASVLGILAFVMGNAKRAKSVRLNKEHEERPTRRLRKRTWFTFGALLVSVCAFLSLRGYCLYRFDPTQWLLTQWRAGQYQPQNSQDAGDANSPNAVTAAEHEPAEKAINAPQPPTESELDALTPEFVNREQNLICLPLWLQNTHNERTYVHHLGDVRNADGYRVILDEQPGLIINWLTSTDARTNMLVTTLVFLVNYLLIIGLASYLLGLRFDPVEGIWAAIFDSHSHA